MRRSHTLVAAVAALAALAALGVVGLRVLARDRARIQDDFANEKLEALEEAAHELGGDVEAIGEDLELAGVLLDRASSPEIADRELHAIATIKREYLAIEARIAHQAPVRVIALDAPDDILAAHSAVVEETIGSALRQPLILATSGPLGAAGDDAWRRVFARARASDGPVIAIVVDVRPLLGRLRLLRDASSVLLVLGARGRPAPASDPSIADVARNPSALANQPDLATLLTVVETRRPTKTTLRESEAVTIGLPRSSAVGVAVPVVIEDGEPWTLALVSSTVALHTQERTLVRRLLLGGGIAAALVVGLAVYFLVNARRAAVLRERLRHVDRLAHLTEKAEKILDHIPSGVLALGEDGTVTAANRWLARRLGRDCVGHGIEAAFAGAPADQIARITDLARSAFSANRARSIHRERMTLFGAETLLNVHAVPLERRIGDVQGLLVFDDLTPLRQAEERLLHSEKLVTAGQLAAGIAHEIGTPLNIARGRAELALARREPVAPEVLRVIVDQIDQVSGQIRQLLDFVRPEQTRIQPVDTESALRRACDLLASEANTRKVAIQVDVPPRTPPIRADPAQLQQILVNLLLNALDACAAEGNVELRARKIGADEGTVRIEVADNGAGIPAADLARVFDPFYTTKKRGQGTGLGLWVVAQLVRAHGAQIDIESAPATGTTFAISWPAAGGG